MKTTFFSALLACGLLFSSTGYADLDYNYDKESKIFAATAKNLISLADNDNKLLIAFSKEHTLNAKGKISSPTYYVRMYVEGKNDYRFADNANYWQEHNYSYEQIRELQTIKAELLAIDAQKKAEKKAIAEAKKLNNNKEPLLKQNEQNSNNKMHAERNLKEQTLRKRAADIKKDKDKLKRNPSTLIYLTVENKLSKPNLSKPLYDFKPPYSNSVRNSKNQTKKNKKGNAIKAVPSSSIPDAAIDNAIKNGDVQSSNKNLMDLELAKSTKKRAILKKQSDREQLAKLAVDNPQAAEKLREEILKREAEEKIATANSNDLRIRQEIAQRSTKIEEVKATRAAFEKYKQEQQEALGDMVYTSTAWAKLADKDNFWKKTTNSAQKNIPLFFEVKFWTGGSNQILWLDNSILKDLNQLFNYDLAKDKEHSQLLNK